MQHPWPQGPDTESLFPPAPPPTAGHASKGVVTSAPSWQSLNATCFSANFSRLTG